MFVNYSLRRFLHANMLSHIHTAYEYNAKENIQLRHTFLLTSSSSNIILLYFAYFFELHFTWKFLTNQQSAYKNI